jgi:hypothetical protein
MSKRTGQAAVRFESWKQWIRAAVVGNQTARGTTWSRTIRRQRNARVGHEVEALELRTLLAVTFQLNFIDDTASAGAIGFNDANATNRQARRDAANTVATRVGSWFNHTATVQVEMRNASDGGDNYLAEVSTPPPSQSGDGFFHTVMGQKIVTNGATDPNGAATDTTMTFNWAQSFELADSFSAGEYDFQATMAHELMHAVGFTANLNENGSSVFGGGAKNWSKFDQFITNAVGASVINQTTFVTDLAVWNPIKTAGTNKVFFGGPQTKAVTGGAGLKLYAPGSFDIASSISHSDDDAPEIASQTHNMTAAADFGRNARGFHISEIGVMKDLGFNMIDTTAQLLVTHSGGDTTVRERAVFQGDVNTDSFTVQLSDKPGSDVVIDVRSMANGEMKVDKTRLTFTTSNWNTPQTITVTGVTDGVVNESPTVPVRLSVIDSLSDANYDPVVDVDVAVKVNQETTQAPGITVTSTADVVDANDGVTTLREAVAFANAKSAESIGANTQIIFSSSVFNTARTITLTFGELLVTGSVEIQGPGADLLTISGNSASRIFRATGGNNGVRITDLTITGGAVGAEGAVRNENTGVMMLIGVNMTGNGQTAVFNAGRYVGIYNSSLTGNTGVSGGAAFNSNGLMDIVNTTVSGNTASANAGGVWSLALTNDPTNEVSRLTVINSTIVNNRLTNPAASAAGGGIGEFASGVGRGTTPTVLINTLVAGNRQGAVGSDVANDYHARDGVNTLTMNVARSANNLIGSVAFAGGLANNVNGNRVGNGSGGDRDVTTVINTTLALNSGKTLSHALASNSPAKDTGLNSILSVAFDGENLGGDQRGLARIVTSTVDIGAIEDAPAGPATPTDIALSANTIVENAGSGTLIGTLSTTDINVGDTFTYALVDPQANVDNQAFTIVGNQLRSFAVFDFEVKSSYSVKIRTTDQTNRSFEKTFTVNITDVSDRPPTLAAIPDALIQVSTVASNLPLTVGDPDTPLANLILSVVSSSNTTLQPLAGIVFGGAGANRTMTITPAAGQSGDSTVVIRVSDGVRTADQTFRVRVRGLDFGDAPASYGTLLVNNGARHFAFGATLGLNFDTEATGFPGANADGDDLNTSDDEDGATFGALRAGQQNATVAVVIDFASQAGTRLDGWIDFDGDGSFGGPGEQIFDSKLVFNGSNSLTFDIPVDARTGTTFARLRVSDAGGLGPKGAAPDGEVEDFKVTVTRPLKGDKVFTRQAIESVAAYSSRGADVDGDGDMDIYSANTPDGDVVWYENNGSQTFTKRTIDANFVNVRAVLAVDLDGDGDLDIAAAAAGNAPAGGAVVWYENLGNRTFSALKSVDPATPGGTALSAADMDGDGDMDLLSSAYAINQQAWHRNDGGGVFVKQVLDNAANGAGDIVPVDLDRDGDMDAVGVARFTNNLTWYNNNGSQVFTAQTLSNNGANSLLGPEAVQAIDVDRDGDLDVVVTSIYTGDLEWFENNGSQAFTKRRIATGLFGAYSVAAADIDGDGDIDMAVSSYGLGLTPGQFVWYENNGSQTFTQRVIVNPANQAQFISLADLNGDGRLDFITSSLATTTTVAFMQGALPDNLAPAGMTLTGNSIPENSASGTLIGTLSTSDPNPGDTFTYSLVSPQTNVDNQAFSIVGNQLRSFAVFDFEAKSSYSVVIRTTDQGNLSFDQTFTVTITDVNENGGGGNTAPVLDPSGNPFAILGVGSRQSTEMRQGTLVSDILARAAANVITDADPGALRGIALTSIDQSLGNFQYTLVTSNPLESDWTNVDAAGAISNSNALLLPTNARLRFTTGRIPHHDSAAFFLNVESKLDTGLTFRAWDRSTGVAGGRGDASTSGGTSAFSAATETIKVYFEARLFRHFNTNASLNVYTLEAEFNALSGGAGFQDRSTSAYSGFTVLLSAVPELGTAPLYRLYYGVQFNTNRTETDMGYRYLTSNLAEAQVLENNGPESKRPQRAGTYFRELGVTAGSAILGYIFTAQQTGTSALTQIYRTDIVNKPTRPPGTAEGGTPTSFTPQENGDHVYTTNTPFETFKPGSWRIEAVRGFVRELNPNPASGAATAAAMAAAEPIELAPAVGSQAVPASTAVWSATPVADESGATVPSYLLPATGLSVNAARLVAIPGLPPMLVSPSPTAEPIEAVSAHTPPRSAASVASTILGHQTSADTDGFDAAFADLAFVTGVLTTI